MQPSKQSTPVPSHTITRHKNYSTVMICGEHLSRNNLLFFPCQESLFSQELAR
uniref:Uncharacterized protein n=1 Tax=Anguilla anguilla TaxID=7936 RepID=A0A0E9SZF6_ANGAN